MIVYNFIYVKTLMLFCAGIFLLFPQTLTAQKLTGLKVEHPEWSYDKTIYEVNVRQYSKEGTFKALENDLPRLKKLGVGIVWLMPIHPIGEKNRKGSLGSYYSVQNYLGVNPEFGTLDDFKSLIKKIHSLGMYIIIDWVANHTAWDNPLVQQHPDWYTKDSLGNFVTPVADWADVIDLNYENRDLWNYMISVLKYWVSECNIDGFRCDVAGMVPLEFWINARTELDKIKKVFMLAEDENPQDHAAFDMTYSWELFKVINKIAAGENNASDIVKQLKKESEQFPEDAFRMRFTSNHDENTWNGTVFERLGESAETFAALTVLIPGMPLIYNGQEAGLNKRLLFFEKDTINWKQHKFNEVYKTLFNFKMNNEILQNGKRGGKLTFISQPNDENVLSFIREKNDKQIIAVFNLSDKNINTEINNSSLKGVYKNLLTSEEINFSDKQSFQLKPWEYKILIK